jgi:hypothetical protein
MTPSIRTALAAVALLLVAASAQSQIQTRYTYSTAGDEVTDSKTGLIWRRCSEGQTWSGSTCTGTAAAYTHEQALAQAQAQAGMAGWRLPNVKELTSIANKALVNPAIDSTAFPVTPSEWYWSSTPYAGDSSNAWSVNFDNGNVNNGSRGDGDHVRLVR